MLTPFISLLRAVNVSGQNPIRMPELKSVYESLGLQQVTPYLQSGNVVFTCETTDDAALQTQIEAAILSHWGLVVPVLIRSLPEFQQLVDSHPFTPQQLSDPSRVAAVFLSAVPRSEAAQQLVLPAASTDWFKLDGCTVYLHCPDGFGRTKLTNAFFEKKLQVTATSRNWNTVNALLEMVKTR